MLSETRVTPEFIVGMDRFREFPKGGKLVEECSKSVVLFAERMLGIRLYSWQIRFLTLVQEEMAKPDGRREFVILTSRQIGKSTALAIFALWACTFNKYPGAKNSVKNNTLVGIVSASDQQAKKLLHDVELYVLQGDRFMRDTYLNDKLASVFGDKYFSSLIDNQQANNTTTVTFKSGEKSEGFLLAGSKSGSVIKSFPPTTVVLGETFSIIMIDEAGKTDRIDDMFFDDYIYPTGNSTNALRMYTSTPWVPSGFFYRMSNPNDEFEDNNSVRLMFTIDAIALEAPEMYNLIKEKTIAVMNRDGKTDEVQRAYYCKFVRGEGSYFKPERVADVFTSDYSMVERYASECDMGIDFGGQVTSRTVITISQFGDDGKIRRLYHKAYEVGKDLSLLDDIEELMKRFNVQRLIPDDCPAGDFLIRRMKEKGWNVEPMNFRQDKVKKYGSFRSAVNRGEVLSYIDSDLKIEMLAMEFSQGTKQSYIQHAVGYTDDLIDSFVMSVYFFLDDDESFRFINLGEYGYDS